MAISIGGILLGIINIAFVVVMLLLVGFIILWLVSIWGWSIPAQIQKLYGIAIALVALGMLVALLLGAPMHVLRWSDLGGTAWAHEAPSGWVYPKNCCGGQDCHPVDCDSIVEVPTGYEWHGLHWSSQQASISGDQTCHVCYSPNGTWSSDGNGRTRSAPLTRCIFLLPTT